MCGSGAENQNQQSEFSQSEQTLQTDSNSSTTTRRWLSISRLREEPVRSNVVLLMVPVLIVLFTYFGSNSFYRSALSSPTTYNDLYGYAYQYLGSFVVLGLGSILTANALGLRPNQIGLGLGDARFGLKTSAAVVIFLVVPITWLGSYSPDVISEYPESSAALQGPGPFLIHSAFYMLYYIGWETFFRGFTLFGLKPRFGAWAAVLIQTIPSTLIHTSIVTSGKPFSETFGAIPAGIGLGWLALRTGSIWYSYIIHAALGILTNFWQYLHSNVS